ncbi:DEKNAAC103429 [Brettanomyces naardenensis]|uniref:Autophagy-related protein 9 n=1 Tax=Brettanomyces naardenensis TaxID=13370 RepID=A0A448YN67_BRENA|nr:DEKNAAC103429 [Brettanomyces naardenensis]
MSDIGYLPKHTFLSRVFGLNSSPSEGPTSDPLLNDDNNDIQLSIPGMNSLHRATSLHSTESDETTEDDDDIEANQTPIPLQSTSKPAARLPRSIHSETSSVNFRSEDDDGSIASSALPYDPQKQAIRDQIRSEFEENNLIDAVPESLLVEAEQSNKPRAKSLRQRLEQSIMEVPGLSNIGERAKQFANKTLPETISSRIIHRRADSELEMGDLSSTGVGRGTGVLGRVPLLSPTERALWIWSNVTNLDRFLQDVYTYYTGNGYQCIILSRVCDLGIIVFVVWLSSFLGNCIDYDTLLSGKASTFQEVRIPQCYAKISWTQKGFYWILLVLLGLRIRNCVKEIRDLRDIKLFYNYLLGITDTELQTISWPTIVKKIMILRDQNTNAVVSGNQNLRNSQIEEYDDDLKSKTRLNAHDIANRLMRKDNYMIAIFNKQVLAKPLKLPLFDTYFLTKTLEWNLKLCIFDYLFDTDGQLKKSVLSEHSRLFMAHNLRRRFQIAGALSIFLTPVLVVYFLLYFFLRFFYEFRSDPGMMNTREFSPYAYWKLREFNELPHIFEKRLKLSVDGANNYLNQFPKERTDIILKFVSFVSGSIVAVLAVFTVFGHENFLNFEITPGRTVLFYMSAFGALFTICKGSISDVNAVFDPEASLRYVAQFTHYLPSSWEGRYHSEEVRVEFCKLFNLKIVLVLKELASLVMLPFLLYVRLPDASERILDFFREFTVHVDGLGYVCSFAMFNFDDAKDKPKTMYVGRSGKWDRDDLKNDYYTANDDKMVKSYMYFLESYGDGTREAVAGGGGLRRNNANLMKSTVLKNAYNDGAAVQRFPQAGYSEKFPAKPDIHYRGTAASTNTASEDGEVFDRMEETTAGLSPDTRNYLKGVSNSILLGKNYTDSIASVNADETDAGGVLGLLNNIYKHQPKQ